MLTGEIAKYQIQDRVRQAEASRVAGKVRSRRSSVRRVGSGLLAVFAARSTGSRVAARQTRLASS